MFNYKGIEVMCDHCGVVAIDKRPDDWRIVMVYYPDPAQSSAGGGIDICAACASKPEIVAALETLKLPKKSNPFTNLPIVRTKA